MTSLTKSFRSHYGLGIDSVFNRKEYQEYFLVRKGGRFLRLSTLPPSCVDCWNMGASKFWNPQGLPRDCFNF